MGYPDDSGNLQMSAPQNRVKWTQSQMGGPDQWQVAEGDVLGISMMDNDPSETHGEGAGEKSVNQSIVIDYFEKTYNQW